MTELVRGRKDAGLKLEDLLHVLLYLYSALDVRWNLILNLTHPISNPQNFCLNANKFRDQFDTEEEERLRSVLGEALLRFHTYVLTLYPISIYFIRNVLLLQLLLKRI